MGLKANILILFYFNYNLFQLGVAQYKLLYRQV